MSLVKEEIEIGSESVKNDQQNSNDQNSNDQKKKFVG